MKRIAKLFTFVFALIVITGVSFGLMACSDSGSGGQEEYFRISVAETRVPTGTKLYVDWHKSGKLYKEYSSFEISKNTCNAKIFFEYNSKKELYETFVQASEAGEVTFAIKSSRNGYNYITSNELTIEFYYDNFINTVEDLKALKDSEDSFILNADLDLSEETNWTPISGFTGNLMGNNHKISNLKISSVNDAHIGLFDKLSTKISDLTIENAMVESKSGNGGGVGCAGILAGRCDYGCSISNVTVSGKVNAKYYENVGGIVGFCEDNTMISDCVNNAEVIGKNYVGGVVGSYKLYNINDKSIEWIKNVVNYGEVTGTDCVGGIAGKVDVTRLSGALKFSNFKNYGTINGTNKIGGLIGHSNHDSSGTFDFSILTNEGSVTGKTNGSYVGGLFGYAEYKTNLSVVENKVDITGGYYVGGLVGCGEATNIASAGEECANVNQIKGIAYVGGFAGQAGKITNAVNKGEIIATGYKNTDSSNYVYLGGIAGYCTGIVDCINYSDITYTKNGCAVGGLAGHTDVCEDEGVSNNENHGSITSSADMVGGIAGEIERTKGGNIISLNTNYGAICGKGSVGGIFGYIKYSGLKMSQFYNHNTVTGDTNVGENVGGLIGGSNASRDGNQISVSENLGDVVGNKYVGGWVGYGFGINIDASDIVNENDITGNTYVGGFIGYSGIVKNATNNGNVYGTDYVGGIAGFACGVSDCINYADITGHERIGGIVGMVKSTEIVENNENFGLISGINAVGGIIGSITDAEGMWNKFAKDVTFNQNHADITGETCVGGIIGYAENTQAKIPVSFCTNDAVISSTTGATSVGGILGGKSGPGIDTTESLLNSNETHQTTNLMGTM